MPSQYNRHREGCGFESLRQCLGAADQHVIWQPQEICRVLSISKPTSYRYLRMNHDG